MKYYGRPPSPKRERVYTGEQILKSLDLCDFPEFHFIYRYSAVILNYEGLGIERLMMLPGFINTQWRYKAVSHEMKPMFQAMDDAQVCKFFRIKELTDKKIDMKMCDRRYHAIPKPELILPVFLTTAN